MVAQKLQDDARAATHLAQTFGFLARNADDAAKAEARSAQGVALALRQQATDAPAAAKTAQTAARDTSNAYNDAARQQMQASRAATKQQIADQKAVANAAKQSASDIAKAQRQANNALVNAGVASHWTPAIGQAKLAAVAMQSPKSLDSPAGQMQALGSGLKSAQSSQSYQQLGETRDLGLKVGLVGTAGLALAGKTAMDAGSFNQMRSGIRGQLGKSEGDAFLTKLQAFDRRSPFNLQETIGQAQTALAMGFKPEELLNEKGTGLFDQLGDSIARAGGNAENFSAAMRQIAQIKSKGGASMQDLNALAEGGKLAIIPTVKRVLGDKRAQEVLSGDKKLTEEEMFGKILPALGEQNKGGMGDAMKELPGQIETLQGALFNLSQTIGQTVVPIVSFLATAATYLADALSSISAPILTILVILGLLGSGLLTVGGTIMVLMAVYGQYLIALEAIKGATVANAVATRIATAGVGTYTMAILGGIALIAIAAWGFYVAAINGQKAASMSEAEWRDAGGVMLAISRGIGDILDWIDKKLDWVRSKLHLGGQTQFDEKQERDLYAARKEMLEKRGEKVETFEVFQAKHRADAAKMSDGDKEKLAADKAKEKETADLAKPGAMPDFSKMMASVTGAPSGNSAAAGLPDGTLLPSTQNMQVPVISGALPQNTIAGGATPTFGGSYDEAIYAAQDAKDKDAVKRLTRQKSRETRAKAAAKIAATQAQRDEIEQRIAALGDGESDVNNLEQLHAQLREATRKRDTVEAAVLRERIARASEAAKDLREQNSKEKREEKTAERQAQQQQDEMHRRRMRDLSRKISGTKDKAEKARLTAQRDKEDDDYRAGKLGGLGSLNGVTATLGASQSPNGLPPIHENEKPWLGYTRQSMNQMPQADALRYIQKQSAYFEKGGFDSEAQMSAWQRAYIEKYGAAASGSTAFGNPLGQFSAFNGASAALRLEGPLRLNPQGIPQMPAYKGYSGPQGGYGNSSESGGFNFHVPVEIQPELSIGATHGTVTVEWKGGKASVPIKDIMREGGARTQNDVRKIKRGVG